MKEEKNCKGRKPKYLTVERFNNFLLNDWRHLNWKVNFMFAILLATLGASIARLILG